MNAQTRPHRWWALVLFLLASVVVAGIGTLATLNNVDGWYADAAKPSWTPPNWLFGPMWSLLYAGMAFAGWRVWSSRDPRRRSALILYWVQLALNFAWTPIFFAGYPGWGVPALWAGAVVIVLLDVCVFACILLFWRASRVAAVIMAVYLLWLLYASTLNFGVAVLAS